jgi:hypothetical protein
MRPQQRASSAIRIQVPVGPVGLATGPENRKSQMQQVISNIYIGNNRLGLLAISTNIPRHMHQGSLLDIGHATFFIARRMRYLPPVELP